MVEDIKLKVLAYNKKIDRYVISDSSEVRNNMLYENLEPWELIADKICNCEPVGETNIVDCNCDEYVEDFEVIGFLRYTDMKDETNTEVFEGDIITSLRYPFTNSEGDNNYVGVIGIDTSGVYYDIVRISDRVSGCACDDLLWELDGEFKVIGNKYTSPELLNVK